MWRGFGTIFPVRLADPEDLAGEPVSRILRPDPPLQQVTLNQSDSTVKDVNFGTLGRIHCTKFAHTLNWKSEAENTTRQIK